ncbi:unnamed protein product [Rangifer tarandus platyrhynchus]|uniref:Uncharacterized protein n=1 Tax=Rangifer tarandus platyrhynchus TaxID=3082113 RepID=A0ABN8ZPW5_RANTA|nr:unnamed protein product [Rangifer tarandus platyrhynchus]
MEGAEGSGEQMALGRGLNQHIFLMITGFVTGETASQKLRSSRMARAEILEDDTPKHTMQRLGLGGRREGRKAGFRQGVSVCMTICGGRLPNATASVERSPLRMKTSLTIPVRKWNLEGILVSKQVSRQVSEQRLQPQTQRRLLDQRPWKDSGPGARRGVQTRITCDPGMDGPPEMLPSLQEADVDGRGGRGQAASRENTPPHARTRRLTREHAASRENTPPHARTPCQAPPDLAEREDGEDPQRRPSPRRRDGPGPANGCTSEARPLG